MLIWYNLLYIQSSGRLNCIYIKEFPGKCPNKNTGARIPSVSELERPDVIYPTVTETTEDKNITQNNTFQCPALYPFSSISDAEPGSSLRELNSQYITKQENSNTDRLDDKNNECYNSPDHNQSIADQNDETATEYFDKNTPIHLIDHNYIKSCNIRGQQRIDTNLTEEPFSTFIRHKQFGVDKQKIEYESTHKPFLLPGGDGLCHINCVFYCIINCESIIKHLKRPHLGHKSVFYKNLSRTLKFIERFKKKYHGRWDSNSFAKKHIRTWWKIVTELRESIGISNSNVPNNPFEFLDKFIIQILEIYLSNQSFYSTCTYITRKYYIRRCLVCDTINIIHSHTYSVLYLRVPLEAMHNIEVWPLINLEGQKSCNIRDKCCNTPTLMPLAVFLEAGAKVLIINVTKYTTTTGVFELDHIKAIPHEIQMKTHKKALLYQLKACIYEDNDMFYTIVGQNSEWYSISKTDIERINLIEHLQRNTNWMVFYELHDQN